MTEKLYDIDSHLKEFCANVVSCEKFDEKYAVVLDRTAFFPEGGGQASDRGYIENARVLDVQITDREIVHITDVPLPVGSTVTGVIDWERRFDFMQQHSGEHIVSGVAHRVYGCENVGFHLSDEIVTLDFDKPLSREQILNLETLANNAVFNNVGFKAYYPDKETLKSLSYRSKKELEGDIRIVEIEDTDMCACCAPHVDSSGEIGLIKLLGTERLRGGVRIEIKCGFRALNDYNVRYENTVKIGDLLAAKYNETALAVERLQQNNAELKSAVTQLKKRITEEKVKAFNSKKDITAEFESDLDIKELQIYADALYKAAGGVRGVFSKAEEGYYFAICADMDRLDSFFKEFKAIFNVRGGGRNGMVQGTVLAERKIIESFFEESFL